MKEDVLLTDEECIRFWDILFQQAAEEVAAMMTENDPLEDDCSSFTPEQGNTRIVGQKTSV